MKATLFLILLFITVAIADFQMESAQEDHSYHRPYYRPYHRRYWG
ncbi:conserved domain protein [Trichinella spiralis]|nr:conserved domain protein [Trichinella spiralis]